MNLWHIFVLLQNKMLCDPVISLKQKWWPLLHFKSILCVKHFKDGSWLNLQNFLSRWVTSIASISQKTKLRLESNSLPRPTYLGDRTTPLTFSSAFLSPQRSNKCKKWVKWGQWSRACRVKVYRLAWVTNMSDVQKRTKMAPYWFERCRGGQSWETLLWHLHKLGAKR